MNEKTVVLIVLDTLRKDYADKYIWPVLRKYGFKKYDRAIAPAPWTLPSHASMLTGLYPLYHGAHLEKRGDVRRKINGIQLQEILAENGYETVLITANPFLSKAYNIRGFSKEYRILPVLDKIMLLSPEEEERYEEIMNKHRATTQRQRIAALLSERELGLLIKKVVEIFANKVKAKIDLMRLKNSAEWPKEKGISTAINIAGKLQWEKVFLLANFMEVHEPYKKNPPSKYNVKIVAGEIDGKLWREKYDEFARYLAEKMDELMRVLEENGVLDGQVVVVSDHGQMLGEYGAWGHGTWLYDELIRVPFYAKNIEFPDGGFFDLTAVYRRIIGEEVRGGVAISESFGVGRVVESKQISEEKKRLLKRWNKYRIAVYYKDYKGIFNVDDWKWESWKTYNEEEEVPEEVKKEMMKIILRHLKGALAAKEAKRKITRSGAGKT